MTRPSEELQERIERIERRLSQRAASGRRIASRKPVWALAALVAAGLVVTTVVYADPTVALPCPSGSELYCFDANAPALASEVNHNFALQQQAAVPGMIQAYGGSAAPPGYLLCDGQAVSRTTYAALFAVIGETYGAGDGSATFNVPDLGGRVPVGLGSSPFGALGNSGGTIAESLSVAQLPAHSHGNGSLSTGSAGNHSHTMAPYSANGVTGNGSSTSASDRVMYNGDGQLMNSYPRYTSTTGNHAHAINGSTANTGSGNTLNNLQPYVVINYIIRI